ncbi:hypothetical protein GCM10008959_26040 [Deinococcus seoulensis]|uniref:Uncharacterized protein n=1 Tax=Deinococcus seoulensis TaxID=1837379 RepID=A0ABQ2RSF4_9DEIO|nr:hypothetical protein [Deinococcus seoulensis]GGR62786.1 hypothetical protein GCM10008959_26040 [Deinococcus seoulensis]
MTRSVMTPEQQGIWVISWALYRGQRHARKQRLAKRNLTHGSSSEPLMDWDEYDARRMARMVEA